MSEPYDDPHNEQIYEQGYEEGEKKALENCLIVHQPDEHFKLTPSQQAFVQLNNIVISTNRGWRDMIMRELERNSNDHTTRRLREAVQEVSYIMDMIQERAD